MTFPPELDARPAVARHVTTVQISLNRDETHAAQAVFGSGTDGFRRRGSCSADGLDEGPVIGKIAAPRGRRMEGLIYYLYGPGRREHTDPHIVAGWRHPAELKPPLLPAAARSM